MSGIGIPTHLPVAAVFQFAEYEQMVTTNARKKKIDPNFKDLDRVVDILTRQSTAWFWAVQQKRAEILGAVVRSLLAQANETEAQHSESAIGRGQVSLKRQRRSATPPSAYEGAQIIGHSGWSSWQDKQKISSDNSKARCAG